MHVMHGNSVRFTLSAAVVVPHLRELPGRNTCLISGLITCEGCFELVLLERSFRFSLPPWIANFSRPWGDLSVVDRKLLQHLASLPCNQIKGGKSFDPTPLQEERSAGGLDRNDHGDNRSDRHAQAMVLPWGENRGHRITGNRRGER